MSDIVPLLKLCSLGIIVLSIYTNQNTFKKINIKEITNNDKSIIDLSSLFGTGISLGFLGLFSFILVHYVYSSKGNNLIYRFSGFLISLVLIILGCYLLGNYLDMFYLKENEVANVDDNVVPEEILKLGYGFSGVTIATGILMMFHILLFVGEKSKLKR